MENAWQGWAAVHLERDLGAGAALAATGPAVFGASAGAGRLLAHRFGRVGQERTLVSAGASLAAAGTVLAALAPATVGVLVGIAAAGLGTAACAPLLLGLAGRVGRDAHRGAAVGTVTTLGYLGFVVSPAAVGGAAAVRSGPGPPG